MINLNKVKNIATLAIIGVLVSVIFFQKCQYNRDIAQKDNALDSLILANQRIDSMKNKLGQTVTTQTAIITSNQAELKKLTEEKFNLIRKHKKEIKEVKAYFEQRNAVVIDSFPVAYVDSVERKKFSDSVEVACKEVIEYMEDSMITVPRIAQVDSPYFKFNQTIKREGTVINSMEIPDSLYFRIVVKKGGFFRKVNGKLKFHTPKQIEFQAMHTNPYIKVIGQTSVQYKAPKKSRVLEKALLIGAGFYLGTKL